MTDAHILADAESAAQASHQAWRAFQHINHHRRAIRDFDGSPLADRDVEAILNEALLAPSSANSQPYVIHWVRDPAIKAAAAAACRNQRAARSASALLVFVSSPRFAAETDSLFRVWVDSTPSLAGKSREYHLRELKTRAAFLRFAPSLLWAPLHALVSAMVPSLSLLPFGPTAVRNWTARSALFAAQTVLLAASARGLDTCPMEGFDPRKLARILRLKRGDVIPLVIAIGRRSPAARIEPRWRRPFHSAVEIH